MKQDARNMNDQPDRFELFTLEDGEEKVTTSHSTQHPNTTIFTFHREDHTLGNLLATALLQTPSVTFAAYKVPHPLFPTFILRVTTTPDTTPQRALVESCARVIADLMGMGRMLTREWEIWKLTNEVVRGREEGEGGEREERMKEAARRRDRIRDEMVREGEEEERRAHGRGGGGMVSPEAARSPLWRPASSSVYGGGDMNPGSIDNGSASPVYGGASPEWTATTTTRAPWESPPPSNEPAWSQPAAAPWMAAAERSGVAPWEIPAAPTGGYVPAATWNQPTASWGQNKNTENTHHEAPAPGELPAGAWNAPSGNGHDNTTSGGGGFGASDEPAPPWAGGYDRNSPVPESGGAKDAWPAGDYGGDSPLPGSDPAPWDQGGYGGSSPVQGGKETAPWEMLASGGDGGLSPLPSPIPESGWADGRGGGDAAVASSRDRGDAYGTDKRATRTWDEAASGGDVPPPRPWGTDNRTQASERDGAPWSRGNAATNDRTQTSDRDAPWSSRGNNDNTQQPQSTPKFGRTLTHEQRHAPVAPPSTWKAEGEGEGGASSPPRDPNSEGERAYARRAAAAVAGYGGQEESFGVGGAGGGREGGYQGGGGQQAYQGGQESAYNTRAGWGGGDSQESSNARDVGRGRGRGRGNQGASSGPGGSAPGRGRAGGDYRGGQQPYQRAQEQAPPRPASSTGGQDPAPPPPPPPPPPPSWAAQSGDGDAAGGGIMWGDSESAAWGGGGGTSPRWGDGGDTPPQSVDEKAPWEKY